ncbi:hypothetical protein [Microbacterium sp. MPKO10]|uniref:hypothetical protein n=1 Tax=Microbacterium sp. MPKO10 TaxID=2989818 RepID=UPI002235DAB6|nr:hypothetical protein [Microbacterium sp. MPKO10]MCW4458207.1 hypothetical protein [Microbacterium sp. MPKO10]
MRRTLIPIFLLALGLYGCSGGTEAASGVATQSSTPAPTNSEATESQVASVLAEYESNWRETIDSAADCRYIWSFGGDDVTGDLEAMTCYLNEQTLVMNAQTVVRDWEDMDVPSSMDTIVRETSQVLTEIGAVDLASVCGDQEAPIESDECDAELGSLNMLYSTLESKLDAWGPYL